MSKKEKVEEKKALTVGVLLNSQRSLSNLMLIPLPIKISWPLKIFVDKVDKAITSFTELRNAKIKELGTPKKDAKGNPTPDFEVKIESPEFPEFIKFENELKEMPVDFEPIEIKIKDLMDYRDAKGNPINLSSTDLMFLEWLIKE